HIKAHRGTVHRALQALSGDLEIPLLASTRLCSEINIYQQNGYTIDAITDFASPAGREILRDGNYLRFFTTREKQPVCPACRTSVVLSAYMTQPNDPCLKYSDSASC